jgi:ATP-dependent Clp protease adaptor protein ClpS
VKSATDTETITVPDTIEELLGDEQTVAARPWIVIVWDDPVNLMQYVVLVFQKLFGYSRAKATKLMLQVHNEGRAVVSSGTREKCEGDVARLHAHGLWATLQREDQ